MKWVLLSVRVAFLIAFISWWREAEGLWGSQHGILQLANPNHEVWMALCLVVGTLASLWHRAHGIVSSLCFGVATACYWFLVENAQPFSAFQWDALLLETGYICVLIALAPQMDSPVVLMEALVFRLMFASGAVKLHGCPAWGSWSAMMLHFETQPLPNPFSWMAHKIMVGDPSLALMASLGTFWVEICLPFLFVLPYFSASPLARQLRKFAAGSNILFMMAIALTGNYTFFNFLTAGILLVPLLNDPQVVYRRGNALARWLSNAVGAAFVVYTVYLLIVLAVRSDRPAGFLSIANQVGLVTYAFLIAMHVLYDFMQRRKDAGNTSLFQRGVVPLLVLSLFALSLASWPRADPTQATSKLLQPAIEPLAKATWLRTSSPYGLFSRMTLDRPELLVEASQDGNTWLPYKFKYKPDKRLGRVPPQIAPFQPRLDWQLWFEAMGSRSPSLWFLSFLRQLLLESPAVLKLVEDAPYKKPKFIRTRKVFLRFDVDAERNYWKLDPKKQPDTSKSMTLDQITNALHINEKNNATTQPQHIKVLLGFVYGHAASFITLLMLWIPFCFMGLSF